MTKTNAGRRGDQGTIAAARRAIVTQLRALDTGQLKAMATRRAPWQTLYRIGRGITKNPTVRALEEAERILAKRNGEAA